ncbi:MAG: ImmA/IrrE family metallo-endopeptidase [Spirochaetaceae bacterium]|jgi:hypothetical protein|nr:ImmA/IrrE family metallo-endopeptidase [Spirochaetaceae bacterium]
MDHIISRKISNDWNLSSKAIEQYTSFFSEVIKPAIKTKYLSHLVTTIEDMVNDKRMTKFLKKLDDNGIEPDKLRGFLASRTIRLYSIILEPVNLKRRATTRHHPSGAIIYYNAHYDEKYKRILIAHELGHIVNKELLENTKDSEETANLFAYIAMDDKNKFYTEECTNYVSKSDIQILNDIINTCPT